MGFSSPMEDPRAYLLLFTLQTPCEGLLRLKQRAQLGRHLEHAALPVLRRTGVEPNLAGGEVDLAPLQRQDLTRDPPTRDIGEPDHRLDRRGKVGKERVELLPLEKPGSDVVLLEHWNMRPMEEFSRLDGEGEHPLQRCEFPVDLAV